VASGPHTDIDRFESSVGPLLSGYPWMDARILAFMKGGTIYNLLTRVVISPQNLVQVGRIDIPAHPSFVITREVLPSTKFREFLKDLKNDQVSLRGRRVELATPSRTPPSAPAPKQPLWWHLPPDFASVQLWDGRAASGERVRKYSLSTRSNEASVLVSREDLEALNAGLLSCRPRWLGFPDLVKRFLTDETGFTFDHTTAFSIELPLRCDLGSPRIEVSGALETPFTAPRLLTKKLKVNALLTGTTGGSWSREAKVSGPHHTDETGLGSFTATLSTRRAHSVIVHLLLGNQIVDKQAYDLWDPKSPNPRLTALQGLGQGFDQLTQVLKDPHSKGRDAETFEIAVSNLFAACGFITLNPGRKHARAGETVDVVAIHPLAPIVFCIECTWRVANNQDKLGKLHERARDLAKVLSGYTVRPMLIMSKDEASPVEISEASALGVILLTIQDLRTLRTNAQWNAGPSAASLWLNGNQKLG
jgi:hypothetical protein